MYTSLELCRTVIRNMKIIETAPELMAITEQQLFAAVNMRIENTVEKTGDWKGRYEFVMDTGSEETCFAPKYWPEDKNGLYAAYYTLTCTEDSGNCSLLSCATGIMGAALCLEFIAHPNQFGLTVYEYANKLKLFYGWNAKLQANGFILTPDKQSIARLFHFNPEELAEDFPNFNTALEPLDAALTALFKVHPEFDDFIRELK